MQLTPSGMLEYVKARGSRIGGVTLGERALAVTTAVRSDVLRDIPTMSDFVPGYAVKRMVWHRRAPEYARRNHQQAQ